MTVFHIDLLGAATALEWFAVAVDAFWVPVSPLWKGATEVLSGHRVLPFNFGGPFFMRGRGEASRQRHALLSVELRSTVKRHTVIVVDLTLKYPLGLAEAVVGGIAGGQSHDRQRDQGKRKDDFVHIPPLTGSRYGCKVTPEERKETAKEAAAKRWGK